VYVFGDNMARFGRGGQAAAMRGEPNSLGIPTKWLPDNRPNSYFSDSQFDAGSVVWLTLSAAFTQLQEVLNEGYTVVIPSDGLGTGLSRLPDCAPKIAAWIDEQIVLLEQKFGSNHAQ